MDTAGLTQHPLYASMQLRGRRLAASLRRVPAHRWRLLCMAVVLVWVVHNLAQAVWVVLPAPELEQPPLAPPPDVADTGTEAGDVDLAAIQQASLFGEASAEPVEVPDEPAVLPGIEQDAVETSLNLRLQGVIAGSEGDTSWAIIADGNRQALYRVGDKLPQGNNASLVKVLEQRVILENNGRYESLWLYSKEDAERRASFSPQPDTEYQNEQYQEAVDVQEEPQASESYTEETQVGEPAEQEVRSIPSSAATEVSSISDVVRFTAARGDGGMMGYRVQPGRDRQLFDQAGLQPGDIVTAVNGISLDDPQQIRAVYQELQTATSAQLNILRDGEHVSIEISLDSAR